MTRDERENEAVEFSARAMDIETEHAADKNRWPLAKRLAKVEAERDALAAEIAALRASHPSKHVVDSIDAILTGLIDFNERRQRLTCFRCGSDGANLHTADCAVLAVQGWLEARGSAPSPTQRTPSERFHAENISADPAPSRDPVSPSTDSQEVEAFYAAVNRRAEADMLAGRPITGAHHRALEAEIAAVRQRHERVSPPAEQA